MNLFDFTKPKCECKKTHIVVAFESDVIWMCTRCRLGDRCYLKEQHSWIRFETAADFWVIKQKRPASNLPVPLCLFVLSLVLEPVSWLNLGCVPYIELPLKQCLSILLECAPFYQITLWTHFKSSMNVIKLNHSVSERTVGSLYWF